MSSWLNYKAFLSAMSVCHHSLKFYSIQGVPKKTLVFEIQIRHILLNSYIAFQTNSIEYNWLKLPLLYYNNVWITTMPDEDSQYYVSVVLSFIRKSVANPGEHLWQKLMQFI